MSNGIRRLKIGKFTFHKSDGTRWRCSARGRGCKVFAILDKSEKLVIRVTGKHVHEPPKLSLIVGGIFQTDTGKRVLILKNYFYIEEKIWPDATVTWKCTSRTLTQCPAFIVLKIRDIIHLDMSHNHPPLDPKIARNFGQVNKDYSSEIMELVSGAQLFKYHGFTYSFHCVSRGGNRRYKCSSKNKHRCRAFVILDNDMKVLAGDYIHNHTAPVYIKHKSGRFSLDLRDMSKTLDVYESEENLGLHNLQYFMQ